MIGEKFWTSGIIAEPRGKRQGKVMWLARLTYLDEGFATEGSTQGQLQTSYVSDDLTKQVTTLKKDAEKMGISFTSPNGEPARLYMHDDGEGENAPDGWAEAIRQAAEATGLVNIYGED